MKNKSKRGQITYFIILVLVLILVIYLIIVLNRVDTGDVEKKIELIDLKGDLKSQVEDFIDVCTLDLLESAIYFNGRQGGYYYPPNTPVPILYDSTTIPFYLFQDEVSLPTISIMKEEIENYFVDNLPQCVNNFDIFDYTGFVFLEEKLGVDVTILENVVLLEMKYPITALLDNSTVFKARENYIASVEFSYSKILSLMKHMVSNLTATPDLIPITYFTDLSKEYGLTYGIINAENPDHYIFYININETINDGPYYFHVFAFDRLEIDYNDSVIPIADLPPETAYVGYPFNYDVSDFVSNVTFSDSTDLFDIDVNTGEIIFVPTSEQIGNHIIEFLIVDQGGNEDSLFLSLEILSDNKAPEIEPIGSREFIIGETYLFDINVDDPENDNIFFSLNSTLYNLVIHPLQGTIYFNPQIGQEGYYTARVDAADIFGNKDTEHFSITVKNEE